MNALWPWPSDTPTERARRIANNLLNLLPDPKEREFFRDKAHALGETWLGYNELAQDREDTVTTAEAAALVHVGPPTIRKWHSEGDLPHVARGRYRVGDVQDCAAEMKRRRAARRLAA